MQYRMNFLLIIGFSLYDYTLKRASLACPLFETASNLPRISFSDANKSWNFPLHISLTLADSITPKPKFLFILLYLTYCGALTVIYMHVYPSKCLFTSTSEKKQILYYSKYKPWWFAINIRCDTFILVSIKPTRREEVTVKHIGLASKSLPFVRSWN